MNICLKFLREQSKRQYKKSLFVIPFFFTFLNAFFGFLSIINSLENNYIAAAYYILLAAFMDGFDGRLARALGSSSCFGMELDSLCDAISFCLAPTVLLYSWYPGEISMFGLSILGLYLCAGLARLARFNSSDKPSSQNGTFNGLPTTIAAFLIASIVLHAGWIATHPCKVLLYKQVLYGLVSFLALLMVSSIKFPAFKKYKISSPTDYAFFVCALIIFSCCLFRGYPLFLCMLTFYLLYGIIYSLSISVNKTLKQKK